MNPALPQLVDLLGVREGIVCVVGAGGKKSLLYALVRGHGGRVSLTATVHTAGFPADLDVERIVDEESVLAGRVAAIPADRSVAYARPSAKPGRHAGVSAGTIRSIHEQGGFAATFVKADGARMRRVKAPAPEEPLIVPGAATVIPVVSVGAVGEPLTETVAHRVERVETVTGLPRGATLTPEALGRLLASDQGALKGTEGSRVVPVINMVDDRRQEELARATAAAALAMTSRFDRVLLCSLRPGSESVVAVVTR
ncbi:selenium cofactor biosynthesis protein YqeC [Lentisalinibacter orientalis]|uniref:selenium cofactor biosynthesis protein YqeC n=1 Tax=Lentisalinibacter orientalis TaxID=2992241 RepID=UPI00386BE736